MGIEANNLAAIDSLTGYRAIRWGRHVELLITDERTYRSEEPVGRQNGRGVTDADFPQLVPRELMEIVDAGRTFGGGHPPNTLQYGANVAPNLAKDAPPYTILGQQQKSWFLERLRASQAPWKIWGSTTTTLEARVDLQNLPADFATRWPGAGYAEMPLADFGSAYSERAEIYDFVLRERVTGFVTVAGDRHSFWAGLAAKALPPQDFEPVGIAFGTGSISAPGVVEAFEYKFPKDHPMRPLYLSGRDGKPGEPTINLTFKHGVRTALAYARDGDLAAAHALTNPDNAPHVSFVDMNGHGYSVVHASADALETEFVCIGRPIERSDRADGGPLRYRVIYRTRQWAAGQRPRLERILAEGDLGLSV